MSSFFAALTDSLDPWKTADMGCIAVRKMAPEDHYTDMESPEELKAKHAIQQSEALMSLIENAITRRENVLHTQESYCLPASASSGPMSSVEKLLKASHTDMALAREEVDEADLLAEQVDMTDLLDVDEVEEAGGVLGNVVAMGSILGKQGVEERHVVIANAPSAARALEAGAAVSLDDDDEFDDPADRQFYHFSGPGDAAPVLAAGADEYEMEGEDEYEVEPAGAQAAGFVAEISDGLWGAWAVDHSERQAHTRAEYARSHAHEKLAAVPTDEVIYGEQCLRALEQTVDVTLFIQGKAHPKVLQLSEDSTQLKLSWSDKEGAGTGTDLTSGSVGLREIKAVEQGARTPQIAVAAGRKGWSCFTIIQTDGAMYDFSVPNATACAQAVCGLRLLLGDSKPRPRYFWKRAEALTQEEGAAAGGPSAAAFNASLKGLSSALRSKRL